MNKTVNINLAGVFFHIDEDAFARLQHYLDAIKSSLANTTGRDEIINDIEARIAELFGEKTRHERQVISMREVDEVIAVMGQPEDYMLDEEIFEDESQYSTRRGKKLFRDTEHSYLGGVSSGLAHFLGTDAMWLRLAWILLTFFSGGGFILIYLALWIFVPEAKTTADKLAMRGEPVTISNIEKKIREGLDDVSEKVKDIDYQKYGYKAKTGATSAATAVSSVVMFFLKIVVKIIGIFLILLAGSALIGLFIGLFSVGTFGIIDAPWTDYLEMVGPDADSIWIISLLAFFAVGIPFFLLFTLGLKLLVKDLKSIGRTAKLVLLAVWIIAVLGLTFFGIQQATERAFDAEVVSTQTIPVKASDTLYIEMTGDPKFNSTPYRSGNYHISYNSKNNKILWSQDVRLIVRATKDSVGKIEIIKKADGKTYEAAHERAKNINYNLELSGNKLLLPGQLTTNFENKYRDQEVEIYLYLPVGTILYADDNTYSFHRNEGHYEDILDNGQEERYLEITREGTRCLDCPEEEDDPWGSSDDNDEWDEDLSDDFDASIKVNEDEVRVRINEKEITVEKDQQKKRSRKNDSVDF
jgi:phage shock protein PspC (stress-responsive transcriptional regulator)